MSPSEISLRLGDCVLVMLDMEAESISNIICDPPYGLEFSRAIETGGKNWDKLDIPESNGFRRKSNPLDAGRENVFGRVTSTSPEYKTGWQAGGGFSKPGIGDRQTSWPSYSATSRYGAANPTCEVCGGRLRGAKKCSCPMPHEHWKPIGKRRNPENEGLPDTMTGSDLSQQTNAMQEWHVQWLTEAYRVLTPGGTLKAFCGTRTYHRLAAAMESVGFCDVDLEAWGYMTGFPKSHDISKSIGKFREAKREVIGYKKCVPGVGFSSAGPTELPITNPATPESKLWEGWGTALKPAWEPVLICRKPHNIPRSMP